MKTIKNKTSQRLHSMFHNLHDKINVRTDFFLHNVFVLYFFFVVSLLFVFYLAFQKEVLPVCVFILVGFITSFFSKNLVVVFFIALTFTSLFRIGSHHTMGFNLEGFTGELDDEENDEDKFLEDKEEDESQNHEVNETEKKKAAPTPTKKPTVPKLAAANSGDEDLNKLQEQTKILLDTQNELIKNIESLTPFLKQAESFTESISKIMGNSNGGKPAVENFATFN